MEPTDEVVVLYQDLELVLAALENGRSLAQARDLEGQLLSMTRRPTVSPLVKQLSMAAERVAGYIGDATHPNE